MAVVGHARFTVLTPNLIRLEYAPDGKFVDAPSWFAVHRDTRDAQAQITTGAQGAEIDTGAIHLTYHDNGKPFSPDNLRAVIKDGDTSVGWKPGQAATGNLGGTLRTLDEIAGPVPMSDGVLARDGWYLLDDSRSPLFVGDWIQDRPANGALDWYLFGYGHDYRAALRSLTAAGGAIPLPRKYTLGAWYSRYWPWSADDFRRIVHEYDEHQFPLDVLVMDMDWHLNAVPPDLQDLKISTWTGYTWDKKLIPDPVGLLKWLHDDSVHVTLNEHPADGIQPHEEVYAAFMRAMGEDPATRTTIPFDAGSKHYIDAFYEYAHVPLEKEGVDFWWLDWQQYPMTKSLPDVTNLQVLNYLNYTRAETGGLRGQSFSRWAGWGDHRYPIQFSGDANTGWAMLAFEVPFTSTGGNVGAFFWSHDIGGHMGGRNEESYTRWCQFGALSAALRSHSTRDANMDRRPWTYPAWAEESMRRSFQLRARLMPYIYTSVAESTRDSVPFIRPVYIDYPQVEDAYHNGQEYFFGDNLLVAPIATPGEGPDRVASQAVFFPDDDWYDFFTGEKFTGPDHALISAPINEFPLFVRGGVPLPMQPYVSRPGTAPLTDLVLRCYPGREGQTGRSALYEDDGVTTGYEHGQSATTPLTYVRHGDQVTITVGPTEGSYQGQPDKRSMTIELAGTAKLTSCSVAAAKLSYEDATQTNRIELAPGSIRDQVSITVTAPIATEVVAKTSQPGGGLLVMDSHPYFLGEDRELVYFRNHDPAPRPGTVSIDGGAPTPVTLQTGHAIPLPGLTIAPLHWTHATRPVHVQVVAQGDGAPWTLNQTILVTSEAASSPSP
jgi:alpha-glucosidase (family GH31 glycosyl hydrolase)